MTTEIKSERNQTDEDLLINNEDWKELERNRCPRCGASMGMHFNTCLFQNAN